MKQYKRTQRKKRNIKYLEVAAAIVLFVAIVSALVIWYNPNAPPPIPKAPATEYFAFSDIAALAERYANTDKIIRIKQLYFNIIPIGGNATNVHINPFGNTDPINYYWGKITNGTSEAVEIMLNSAVQSVKKGTMFPIRVEIYSDQAEGYVTLEIPEDSVFLS